MTEPVRVLFVCLGNICRSPTAHGVFLKRLEEAELSGLIQVDSCGTDGWHVGEAPDPRATEAAAQRGYDFSSLRARQFSPADFNHFDYVLAMDRNNLAVIEQAVLRVPGAIHNCFWVMAPEATRTKCLTLITAASTALRGCWILSKMPAMA
jgi:protein-tyrosine phosphatase